MASNGQANAPDNGRRNKAPAVPVIRSSAMMRSGAGISILALFPAFIVSALLHVVLLALFLLVTVGGTAASGPSDLAVIETKVEENPQEKNLENDEIGNDPEVPTNYNVDRIEDVSVPGPVVPGEAVGIKDAPVAPPATVPPPAGLGGNTGQGGGIEVAGLVGKGNLFGTPGGMGGPLMTAGGFGGRSGSTREKMVTEGGGNTRSEASVAAGLKWFCVHQAPDGHWSLDGFSAHGRCNCTGFGHKNDIAGTAFGLLPLLGAGETHKGTGKNHAYAKNVERALKFLMMKQNREGDFGGGMYAHGLATIAMCEAYGLTSDPALKVSAQRAIDYVVKAQHDAGGWRYGPRQAGDTSVVGWQVMALKSGQMSGLSVPRDTLKKSENFLNSVASSDGASYGYTGPGNGQASAMTAAGLLCRQYLGWGPKNPGMIKGVETLKRLPPKSPVDNMYYYYYATQVMHHFGGEAWTFWNEGIDNGKKVHPGMRDALIDRQEKVGKSDPRHTHQIGSWSPNGDAHGGAGGRLMVTSLSLLTLEVYYRHLPLYRRDMGGGKDN